MPYQSRSLFLFGFVNSLMVLLHEQGALEEEGVGREKFSTLHSFQPFCPESWTILIIFKQILLPLL
jgi:hypothetical protein